MSSFARCIMVCYDLNQAILFVIIIYDEKHVTSTERTCSCIRSDCFLII